jgi:para-aminobenzoate synthetase component 1
VASRQMPHPEEAAQRPSRRAPDELAAAVPLVREIAWRDPATLFAPFANRPGSMLLDSPGSPQTGRHAFIAVEPFQWLKSKDGAIELDGRRSSGNPFAVLRRELHRFPLQADSALPPFQGGVVGCFGYELARHLEQLPVAAGDDRRFPDLALGFYDVIVAVDCARRRAWILSSGHPEPDPYARRKRAAARLEAIAAQIASAADPAPPTSPQRQPEIVANFSRAAYEAAVQRVIDYILAGDIFQANLSQRFDAALPESMTAWDLYRRLCAGNPADFAAYLALGDTVIASASPERFLRLSDDRVETWPIKGTRPRGATPAEDAALAAELLASEKDRAENVMIVDLLRNDLSRVCRDGSIEVPSLCRLETLPTVFHLVSTVTGRLRAGLGPVDLLEACFPGGSITGAPKIRAMEIIAELEPTQRGPYCGTIGYIGFDGAMDSSIVIRTFAVKDRRVTFQTGGGIVADSSPAEEYDETLAKARALIAALSPASADR